jgi:Ca2+-binding EF-hand superfamily protein
MKVVEDDFVKIVEKLTLANLTDIQVASLAKIFDEYAKDTGNEEMGLDRDGLAALMEKLGHPEDNIELEFIMHEWDRRQNGYLLFDAVVSMVATCLKKEELDQRIEQDFLRLCSDSGNLSAGESKCRASVLCREKHITVESLLKGFSKHAPHVRMNRELADDMIFDADISRVDFNVSIDELINTLELVNLDEVTSKAESDESGAFMAPTGMHLQQSAAEGKLNDKAVEDLLKNGTNFAGRQRFKLGKSKSLNVQQDATNDAPSVESLGSDNTTADAAMNNEQPQEESSKTEKTPLEVGLLIGQPMSRSTV